MFVATALAGHDRGDQPVVGVVHRVDRLVEIAHGVQRRLGAEDLVALVGVALREGGEAHQPRPDVRGRQVGLDAQHSLAARFARQGAVMGNLVEGGGGDERPHEDALLEGRPRAHAAQDARELLGEGVDHRRLDEQPAGAGAALPGGRADRDGGLGDGKVKVGVGQHDHRVLAAHLERQQLAGLVERGLAQRAAGRVGAGEQNRVHVAVDRQGAARVRAALDDLDHTLRHARLAQ